MLRSIALTLCLLGTAGPASAHFVFVVPDYGGHSAKVILSETLEPEDEVPIDIIAPTRLSVSVGSGPETDLKLTKSEIAFTTELPVGSPELIHGIADLGVVKRGDTKPNWLIYYPKTIIGDPIAANTRLDAQTRVELIPIAAAGGVKFQFLADSKPVAKSEVDVILPDGTDQKTMTDPDGNTPAFSDGGRYGVWARHVEPTAGELNGKHYDEIRRYATLVIDLPGKEGTASATLQPPLAPVSPFKSLPEAASSFGAVACDGWLYVYGGHTADTHSYSTESVSGKFNRLNLANPGAWESLPGGPALQGMNLATWHGKVYRIGGMNPRNKAGEDADVRSVADCACFDPATKSWTEMAALPEPRSSHDLAVVGNQLIVVGGWDLTGDADNAKWLDTTLILDLSADKPAWKSVPQPFERRALICASYQNKVYTIGGFQTESDPSRAVDVYDPTTNQWSKGPELPGKDMNGFGPAACTMNGKLYVSVADGSLLRLDGSGKSWETIAKATPRIVHRLVPGKGELLVLGGAAKQKQQKLIEGVKIK